MRIPRLYHPEDLAVGLQIQLSAIAFQHAVRVLRLRQGAPVILFNGQGGEYQASLCEIGKRSAQARIEAFVEREAEALLPVTLGQCISKSEHMDFAVQKATELGVAAIQPLFSERSTSSLQGERLQKKWSHWRGIIVNACEQCGRNRLPLLHAPLELESWLQETTPTALRLVLAPAARHSLRQLPAPSTSGGVSLLIGPEGGLSEQEIKLAQANGFTAIGLGPRILRTETAALTALTAVLTLWGDLA